MLARSLLFSPEKEKTMYDNRRPNKGSGVARAVRREQELEQYSALEIRTPFWFIFV